MPYMPPTAGLCSPTDWTHGAPRSRGAPACRELQPSSARKGFRFRLDGHDQGDDQVGQQAVAADEGCQDEQQPDHGRVDAEVFPEASAYPEEHPVVARAVELSIRCRHVHPLSLNFRRQYLRTGRAKVAGA